MDYFVYEYYKREDVIREIVDFLKDRWIAIHCNIKMHDGRLLLLRYHKGKPLRVRNKLDFLMLLTRLKKFRPRTFYGSANLYKRLETKEDAMDYLGNVFARTPTWDIDSKLDWWKYTIKVGELIVRELEKFNVVKSVYLKWSGRGLHVHIHEKAISNDVYSKIPPLDVAYCIVEYINKRIEHKLKEINRRFEIDIKVENLMDPQRVFTAPMSLHRELNIACIAFKPEQLDDFDIFWCDPAISKHNPKWREYEEGEADELALKAYEVIGPYPKYRGMSPNIKLEEVKPVTKKEITAPKFSINDLRYNPSPQPLKRKIVGSPFQAFLYIEDILNHYIKGNLTLDETISLLINFRDITLLTQGYSESDTQALRKLCDDVIQLLIDLRSRESLKKWLLSRGKPRSISKIDDFFSSKK